MAVYTHIDAETLDRFLGEYNIGEPVAFKGIAEGVENSNYYLETTTGRYILTLFEKRINPEELPFFVGVMDKLVEQSFPAPSPIQGQDGRALRDIDGKPALIVSFLSGMSPSKPNVQQCRSIGAAMAHMHLALQSFEMYRQNDLSVSSWAGLFEGRAGTADSLSPGLSKNISLDLAELENFWPASDSIPQGIIHADLFPDNAFFLGDDFSGVIDFYFACHDMLAYDLAVNLNAWCFEKRGEFNLTKGQALLAGYESVRPLDQVEKSALPILARGAAMRFFLTRLVDWTNTPSDALVRPKNPLEYAEKLAFHRKVQSSEDYGL